MTNLQELHNSSWQSLSVKEELRQNLIYSLQQDLDPFANIHGYDHTVIPQLERAILSKHNINLLGLRGQAKTRIARQMTNLLDEYIPYLEGTPMYEDPLAPMTRQGKELVKQPAQEVGIKWLHRSERFYEKLATPDVTVADLIGDIDPIKAANLRLSYADDRVIHYGMIPRANRSIFVINELPDLQARIQVALFNILQEGDIQIRGFKMRLPVDIQFVFTANPEDYTHRGSIVTPLKDRIGSQILTHYPKDIATAKIITQQEAKNDDRVKAAIHVPELAKDLIEQIGFSARNSPYVDEKSGVSARMSITAYESLLSAAERRMLLNNEAATSIRFSDFLGVIPAITGKVELVYEGEQEGAIQVAEELISEATKTLFPDYFPEIKKLTKPDEKTPYDDLVQWFYDHEGLELVNDLAETDYAALLDDISPLEDLLVKHQPAIDQKDRLFVKEFLLWGLVYFKQLANQQFTEGVAFNDLYSDYLRGL